MEPSRFRRLIDSVIGVGFVQTEGVAVPMAAIVMPEGEPVRYAMGDLPGYGLEVYEGDEVPACVEFERRGVKGIGFVQTNTGNEIAAIAWPDAEPRRYPVIDLAGVGVSIITVPPVVDAVETETSWDHSADPLGDVKRVTDAILEPKSLGDGDSATFQKISAEDAEKLTSDSTDAGTAIVPEGLAPVVEPVAVAPVPAVEPPAPAPEPAVPAPEVAS